MKNDDNSLLMRKIYYLLIVFSIIILSMCSYFYIRMGLDNKIKNVLDYESSSDINYKVYLKKNNFFNEEYLTMNKTYIASLIDHLDVIFTYNLKYSELVSGKYNYYVKATILADKDASSNTNYWSKSYILTEPETIEFSKINNYNITTSVIVDYQKYSDLLKEFRKEYGLSITGLLKLELIVESETKSELIENVANINSSSELTIPLTEQAIELSINAENDSNSGSIVEEVVLDNIKYKIFLVLGTILGVLAIILLGIFIYELIMLYKSKSKYAIELKKIMSAYDSIIVNVSSIPNFNKYKVINVLSFDELIDAHSEVRMPINYFEEKPGCKSVFVLINGDIVWMYTLLDENYRKRILKKKS
ncbi:MAG: DUF5305 family protein [bacterium]|nr:DUF5305 family protein [bacterium]